MTTDDFLNERGKVTKQGEVPLLDPAVEYILQLEEMTLEKNKVKEFKGKSKTIDEFRTVWKVEGQNVKVWQSFNRSWNKKSTLVAFVERLYSTVLQEDEEHTLGEFFVKGMRIRCHLELQKGADAEARFYNIALNTLRKYNAEPATLATSAAPATAATPTQESNPEVGRILEILQKGKFEDKDQALSIMKEYMEVKDVTAFAVAWHRWAQLRNGNVVVGS